MVKRHDGPTLNTAEAAMLKRVLDQKTAWTPLQRARAPVYARLLVRIEHLAEQVVRAPATMISKGGVVRAHPLGVALALMERQAHALRRELFPQQRRAAEAATRSELRAKIRQELEKIFAESGGALAEPATEKNWKDLVDYNLTLKR